jgi:hypothetical protein
MAEQTNNVRVRDPGLLIGNPVPEGALDVNVTNTLDVNLVSTDLSESTSQFFKITNIAAGIETDIATLTVPANHEYQLERIALSGNNVATYTLYVDGSPLEERRTYWGYFNETFNFTSDGQPESIEAGSVIRVTALHNSQSNGDFSARIQFFDLTV